MMSLKQLVLAAACLVTATGAGAQCRLCGEPTTVAPVDTLTGDVDIQIETNLNFDRMVFSGAGPGAATIRPDGSNGLEGSVLELGPRATVGLVLVHGSPNRSVRIDVPRRIQLFSLSGGQMTLDDVTTDVPTVTHLDAAGNLSFHFGGRLLVMSDSDGPFRGDLAITVEYQ
jgi:hypothetical protein